MDTVFSISLPRQAYTVAVVRDVLGALLRRSGLCAGCVDDILLAASEACSNAVEHGETSPDYEVSVELATHWCELQISQPGRAPESGALVRRFASEHTPLPGLTSESGRGISLMRYLMDEVDLRPEPHTTVILRKRVTTCDPAHRGPRNGASPRRASRSCRPTPDPGPRPSPRAVRAGRGVRGVTPAQ
ncbi:ATP-binding protein [Nocardiopsis eucommiae]|uniref:ATP-binding protein n=1 Tax=Nocardiopsis eucommiae TaxID=2831970 RepID=A0A975QKZ2_9ACTN|nr:ATP-binding protein [Nocardiopsis eucommiae]